MTKYTTQLSVPCVLSSLVLVVACGGESDETESRPGEEFVIAEEEWGQASDAASSDADAVDSDVAIEKDAPETDTAELIAPDEEEVEEEEEAEDEEEEAEEADVARGSAWGFDDPGDPGLDGGTLGVAVFDGQGTLVALHPAFDVVRSSTTIDLLWPGLPGVSLREHITSSRAFKILATNVGPNRGARLTFNDQYDADDRTSFVPILAYGTFPSELLKANSLVRTSNTTRVLWSAQLHIDPDAVARGSLVHANPNCFIAGAGGGTFYNEGALTLQAVAVSNSGAAAFHTVPSPDPVSLHGVAVDGVLYEISVFITDYTAPCR